MRITILTSILLALLATPLLFAQQTKPTTQPTTQPLGELAVVSTWDDLLKQPSFQIDGEDFHFGIESDTCSANTGVLVYCTSTSKPRQHPYTGQGEPLGPVYVKVINIDRPMLYTLHDRSGIDSAQGAGPVFHATAARVKDPGNYEVQVINNRGHLIQKKQIKVTKAKELPWILFTETEKKKEVPTYQLLSQAGLPHWNGLSPRDKAEKLPKLLEAASDPTFQVSAQSDADKTWITVKSAKWIEDDIRSNFLVRFWINDEPLTRPLGRGERLEYRLQQEARKIKEPLEFRFQLNLDRKALGAAPKDKIEFQLLYSSDGVQSGEAQTAMHARSLYTATKLSNRARWPD